MGEWQCEVRWGARRVVARRAQGAVGNVSKREWGNFQGISKRDVLEFEEKEKEIWKEFRKAFVSICTHAPLRLAINRHGC